MYPGGHVLLFIALRTTVIYAVVLLGMRLSGKREVGQMTPFDLTLLLLLSNAVQNAMTGPDTSVLGGVVAAGTLLLLNYLIAELTGGTGASANWCRDSPACWFMMASSSPPTWPASTSAWMNCTRPCGSTESLG